MANLLSWLGGVANGIGGQINRTANQVQRNVVNPAVNFGVRNVQQAQRNVAQLPANVQRGAFDLQQQANNARKQAEEEARRIAEQRTREIMSIGNQAQQGFRQTSNMVTAPVRVLNKSSQGVKVDQSQVVQDLIPIPRLANISADTARNVLGNIGRGTQQQFNRTALAQTPKLAPIAIKNLQNVGGNALSGAYNTFFPVTNQALNTYKDLGNRGAAVSAQLAAPIYKPFLSNQQQARYNQGVGNLYRKADSYQKVGLDPQAKIAGGDFGEFAKTLAIKGTGAGLEIAPVVTGMPGGAKLSTKLLRGGSLGAGANTAYSALTGQYTNKTPVELAQQFAIDVAGGYGGELLGHGLGKVGRGGQTLAKEAKALDSAERASNGGFVGGFAKLPEKGKNIDPLESLKQEARKYKSAEEFVGKDNTQFADLPNYKFDITQANKDFADVASLTEKITTGMPKDATKAQRVKVYKDTITAVNKKYGTNLSTDINDILDVTRNASKYPNELAYEAGKKAKTDLHNQAHAETPTPQAPKAEAPDPLESLKQEARKYKSADRFAMEIKDKEIGDNLIVYKGKGGDLQMGGKTGLDYFEAVGEQKRTMPKDTVSFSTDKFKAREYGDITPYAIKKSDIMTREEYGNLVAKELGLDKLDYPGFYSGYWRRADKFPDLIPNIKKSGYKAFQDVNGEIVVLDKKAVTDLYNQATKTKPIYGLAPKPGKTPMKPGSDSFKTDTVENIIKDLKGVSQEFRDKVGSNINKNISVEEVPFSKLIRTKTPASKRLSSVEKLGSTDYVTVIKEGNRYRPVDGQHRIAVAENSGKSSLKMIVANSDSNMTTEQIKNQFGKAIAPEPKTAKVSIAELQKNDTLGLMNTKDDIAAGRLSRTKGPVEVVKTSEGHLLIDGNHRALEAQMAGKSTVDAIVLSPEEAMKKYGDYLPQLKFVLDATGDLPVDKLNRPIYETAPKPTKLPTTPGGTPLKPVNTNRIFDYKSDGVRPVIDPKHKSRVKVYENPYYKGSWSVVVDGKYAGELPNGGASAGNIYKIRDLLTEGRAIKAQDPETADIFKGLQPPKTVYELAPKPKESLPDVIQAGKGIAVKLNKDTIFSTDSIKKDRFGVPFKEESVPVAKLTRNQEYQPRIGQSGEATTANVFKKGYQEGLSDQPMLVRKEGDKYTVLGGHSRTMGIEQRAKAGLDNPTNIKARVYENITDEQARQISRGANQGAQYESTLDMAKSISASISENKAPSVQKQNMVKGFGHDDYKYLWDVVKDNNILKEKVNAGGISAEETLAIARQGRVKGLEPEKVAGVIQGLDKAGKLTRQNAKNVINLLSGKIKAGQMRTNQIGMFGDVEKAVKAVDLLDEYQKVSAELVKKRNALAIATDTLDKKSPAYKELRLKVKEYGQKLKTVETEVVNQYNAKISKNVPEIPSKTPPPPKPPTKKVRMNEYGELQVKERGFVTTVKNSPQTTPEVAKGVKGKYEPINNIDTLDTARKEVGLGKSGRVNNKKAYEEAIDTAKRSEDYSTETQAQSLILIEHLQSKGRTQDAIDIVEKMSERATKNGQASQILAAYNRLKPEGVLMMAQREIDKAKAMNPTKYADLKIEKVQATKLRKMATELQGLTGDERIVAQKEMLDEIGRLVPTPNMTKAVTLWKAGLLTGIKGGVSGNAVGNASNILVKKIADAPASAIDTVITQFTGNRSKVFTLKGWLSGFGEGLKDGKKQIQLGTGADDLASKLDYKKVYFSKNNPAGRFAQKYTDFVFGFYSASDKPWKMAALKNSLTDLATVEAKNKGLKGAAKAKFIKETVEAPPDNLLVQATNDSLDATFQDATALGGMLSGAKRSLAKHGPVAGAVGEVVAPFTGIPSSVATKMYRYSLVSSAVDIVRAIKASNKGQFDQAAQRKVSESIGKGLTGTALLGTGYALWNAGLMTTGMPQDPKERDLWELEGKQPWSVKVGGEWLSLNYTGPVPAILGAGATAAQSIKEGNTLPQTAFIAGMGTAKAVLESSPLKGVQSTLDVISDPARNGPRYLESLAGSTIPTISADVASSIDPLQREAMSPLDAMTNRVPIWRYGLNPKLNPFGEPKANQAFGVQAIVDPFRMSEDRTTSLTTELRNLYNTNKDLGTMPSDFKKDFYGGDTKLNEKQIYDLTAKIKPEIKQAWEQIIADPRYQGLNPEQRKKVLDKAAEDIRAARKFETGVQGGFLNEGEARKKLETGAKRILRGGQTDYINKETGGEDTPKQKYETALNDYEDKKKNGEISSIDEIKIQKALKKLQAQSNFDQDTVDLYGLSLKEIDGYLKSQPNGGDIYQKLLALDDAMEAAGATRKFKNRKLVVSSGKKSTKGRKAKKGGKAKKGTAIKIPSISGSAYKAPKFVTRKIASRKLSTKALPKIKAGKVYV